MDRKELDRIFDKFYRTKKAEQSGVPGSGIGLSLVDQIVKEHGGEIYASNIDHHGARIVLELPVQADIFLPNAALAGK